MRIPRTVLVTCLAVSAFGQGISFQKDIHPILKARCLGCHSGTTAQAGLDVSSAELLVKGGRSGPAIAAGDAARSLMMEKIVSGSMPPTQPKLTEAEVRTIRDWIDKDSVLELPRSHSSIAATPTERDVLPMFQMRCVVCHGKRKQEGGLDLRTHASRLKGGKSGPALIPGKPDESLIVKRIAAGEMPPPKLLFTSSVRPATEAELKTLRDWIAASAPTDPPQPSSTTAQSEGISEKARQFWSFQPPQRPPIPEVRNRASVRNPIDAFLLQKLEAKNLSFSKPADPVTLLRRLYVSVTGLPPSPADVDRFVQDSRPDAWEREVDRVLASPHYGERWGRYWLDAVGYMDSEGKVDADDIRPHAWRYRDYVIRSLNDDKPYDRFLLEQIAGDETVAWKQGDAVSPAVLEKLVATGFWRMAPDGTYSPAQSFLPERMNVLADQIEIFGSAVLGLTINCARCHNHKYDPLPQRDYYRFSAILQTSYDPYDWIIPTKRHLDVAVHSDRAETSSHNAPVEAAIGKLEQTLTGIEKPLRTKLLDERLAALPDAVQADLRTLNEVEPAKRSDVQKYLAEKFSTVLTISPADLVAKFPGIKVETDNLRKQIAAQKAMLWEKPQVRALYEMGGEASRAYLLRRGEALAPVEPVEPGVPAVFSSQLKPYRVTPSGTPNGPVGDSSGRRLALAQWIVQPIHPLTSRVIVNRIWMHHFGRGIVPSVANFGTTGAPPTHPELLDWLATEFVAKGWSIKAIHRLILTSTAWRQSSKIDPGAASRDGDNILLSRMPMRRMDADALHDSVLAVTGRLDKTLFGRPAPIEIREDGEVVPKASSEGWRRAIYVLQRRRSPVTMLEAFDTPPMLPNCIERSRSTTATQALQMMNSTESLGHARYLAGRLLDEHPSDTREILDSAYRRVLSRPATPAELHAGVAELSVFETHWRNQLDAKKEPTPVRWTARWMALGDFVHALLNSAEFLYVD